jgi:arsenate reductase (thioredoxin)
MKINIVSQKVSIRRNIALKIMAMTTTGLLPILNETVEKLKGNFNTIPEGRKRTLKLLSDYISMKIKHGAKVDLNFICTHNSRRSHIAQLWAQAASYHYDLPGVRAFSGGTEATAFNPRAVKAMQDAGFAITKITDGDNPVYEARFSSEAPAVKAFSKKYNDPFNPAEDFAAVMTCSHADENCPLVSGAAKRFSVTYDDPKDFDSTPEEETKYRERVMEIGRDILYAFSIVAW